MQWITYRWRTKTIKTDKTKNCVGLKIKINLTININVTLYYRLKLHTRRVIACIKYYNSILCSNTVLKNGLIFLAWQIQMDTEWNKFELNILGYVSIRLKRFGGKLNPLGPPPHWACPYFQSERLSGNENEMRGKSWKPDAFNVRITVPRFACDFRTVKNVAQTSDTIVAINWLRSSTRYTVRLEAFGVSEEKIRKIVQSQTTTETDDAHYSFGAWKKLRVELASARG